MKYIDADKLIAKIEQRKQIHKNNLKNGFPDETNKIHEDDNILSIISSLQQEQPEVDFENYLENYFKGWHIEEEIGLTKPDGWSCIVDDIKDIARHFYELGLNPRKDVADIDDADKKTRKDIKAMVDSFKQVIFIADSYGNSYIKYDTKSTETAIELLEKATEHLRNVRKEEQT